MYILLAIITLILVIFLSRLIKRTITVGIWSIKVFNSDKLISAPPHENVLESPTLQALDVTDVPAEFIADPFIISHDSKFSMFFEVLDKSSGRGVIGLATSLNGEKWNYERIVLKENYHLSYPYVFKFNNEFYMIPESSEANQVILYRAKNFPYEWDVVCELISGRYVDASIFQYNNKWWMLAGKSGKLHLFFSDRLEEGWEEHPKSPLITDNPTITRPGGRVIVEKDDIFRYTQDGKPHYGSAVRVFRIKVLSETEYEEEQINLVLSGTQKEIDWRKDGMHTIDQIKTAEDKWLIVVDGHRLEKRNYLLWRIDSILCKGSILLKVLGLKMKISRL
ncbi:hypothetical protein AB4114_12775 [Paenibacillus sp. 2RAB27]|uniref:glucosamine inositolphosphorylceramide transferase family protein n=1 Tax=Paenibacillus sp. 2RAB27 TaxID=3232991 RepID=UPI003F9B1E55